MVFGGFPKRRRLVFPSSGSSGAAPVTLLTDLISHWKLDEASGNATDSHGTNTLTDTNTVTAAAGKLGTARQFTAATSEYFERADNADLSTGNIDFTIACWVYLDAIGVDRGIAGKAGSGASATDEWLLMYQTSSTRFRFGIRGGTDKLLLADSLGAPATATWYFIVGWHDAAADTVNIQVNNGTVDSLATAGAFPVDSTQSFKIGAWTGGAQMDGRIDSVSFWKRVLTAAERTALYNAGFGLEYPFTETAMPPLTGLSLWLKADQSTFQDSALTTLATADAAPVGGWVDQSGAGIHAIQGTAGSRPILKTAIQNGRSVIRFDGTDDFMTADALGAVVDGTDTPVTVAIVHKRTAGSRTLWQFSRSSGAGGVAEMRLTADTTNQAVVTRTPDAAGGKVMSRGTADTAFHVTVFILVGGITGQVWMDGVQQGADGDLDVGVCSFDQFTLGENRLTSATFFNGDIGEVLVYPSALSEADRNQVESYLGTKWGITVA